MDTGLASRENQGWSSGTQHAAAVGEGKATSDQARRREADEIARQMNRGLGALRGVGDLQQSREAFEKAARLAASAGLAQQLGTAAVGLGGFWVHEVRDPVLQALVDDWRTAALEGIDASSMLAVRLRARIAAERDYETGEQDKVLSALDDARGCGDRLVLAEALHLAQHCLLGPGHVDVRLSLCRELLTAAGAESDSFEERRGLLWRTTNLYLAGDVHADRALNALRAALDAQPHLAMSYVLSAMDVMCAIREGSLERAVMLAEESAELGRKAGDLDVLGWYGAHVTTIRYYQGRAAELIPLLRDLVASPEMSEPNDAFLGALATAASMAGDTWSAASALRRLRRPSLDGLQHNSIWLVTMYGAALAARHLDDVEAAAEVYELLLPYAHLPSMASFAVTCFGSTHYPLGVAAASVGKLDVATDHYRHALAANEAIGHRPAHVLAAAALAETLDASGEVEEARHHWSRARTEAAALGMEGWLSHWDSNGTPTGPLAGLGRSGVDCGPASCARSGAGWQVRAQGRQVSVPDSIGMTYLATLVRNPGVEIPALTLTQGQPASTSSDAASKQLLLDGQARDAYRHRLTVLEEQIEDAEARGDADGAELARTELDWILRELGRTTGIAGRTRAFTGDAERARSSVQKAIRRALDRIIEADPVVGDHFAASVSTGVRCSYRPA